MSLDCALAKIVLAPGNLLVQIVYILVATLGIIVHIISSGLSFVTLVVESHLIALPVESCCSARYSAMKSTMNRFHSFQSSVDPGLFLTYTDIKKHDHGPSTLLDSIGPSTLLD